MNLIEVFRRKKRLYLVFEFVDHTALDDLEKYPTGSDENFVKKIMWQVLKGVEFCHAHNVNPRPTIIVIGITYITFRKTFSAVQWEPQSEILFV